MLTFGGTVNHMKKKNQSQRSIFQISTLMHQIFVFKVSNLIFSPDFYQGFLPHIGPAQ